ncbi:MAG TPA: tail fiber domain-containing protein [Candidatus Udaeobacter sp.]
MKTLITSNRSLSRCGFFTLAIALCWVALSPSLKAQCQSACPGGANTALGVNALGNVNPAVGINNTAVGANALSSNTDGFSNVAVGASALANNTTGQFNMAIGTEALRDNNANFNLAIGFRVGFLNTTGKHLTGIGAAAMRNNTTGEFNTAIGADALRENSTTSFNVAVGDDALTSFNGTASTDGANTALGSIALNVLTSGQENVAVGRRAGETLTDGSNNVIVGWRAGDNLATGDGNTFIGDQAGQNEGPGVSDVICLGTPGDTQSTGQTTNNRCYIGHIVGVTTGGPSPSVPVVIDQDGQLGTVASSRRFKEDIEPIDQASEAVLKLKPVTFHYKNRDVKKDLTPQFGLIAEDVEQVNRDLVAYGKDGKVYSVRYDAVDVMLLNEFLKEHKKVEEQQASIADLKSTVASQQKDMGVLSAQLKEQASQIQKVSARLEASKPAAKVVANK